MLQMDWFARSQKSGYQGSVWVRRSRPRARLSKMRTEPANDGEEATGDLLRRRLNYAEPFGRNGENDQMGSHILVTGGAGFIGSPSHSDDLLDRGDRVTVHRRLQRLLRSADQASTTCASFLGEHSEGLPAGGRRHPGRRALVNGLFAGQTGFDTVVHPSGGPGRGPAQPAAAGALRGRRTASARSTCWKPLVIHGPDSSSSSAPPPRSTASTSKVPFSEERRGQRSPSVPTPPPSGPAS